MVISGFIHIHSTHIKGQRIMPTVLDSIGQVGNFISKAELFYFILVLHPLEYLDLVVIFMCICVYECTHKHLLHIENFRKSLLNSSWQVKV